MPALRDDEEKMRRAIALAERGVGRVEPNPAVGCVIARDGLVLGEGHHETYGGPHAEVNALAACRQPPAGATAYVTLEPCCHTNKRTPPCVPALIAAGLRRVVVGCVDPNPSVNGQGIAQLRQAGINVTVPVLESACRRLIAPFIKNQIRQMPYVTLKWAQTADGKVAGAGGSRLQISGPAANRQVHLLRAKSQAILVGIGTVLADDPLLTVRLESPDLALGGRPPLRVILDGRLRTPLESRLVQTAAQTPVVLYCTPRSLHEQPDRAAALSALGVRVRTVPDHNDAAAQPPLGRVLADLFEHERTSNVLAEPGPTLARRFMNEQLADRIWIIRSAKSIGELAAPAAPELPSDYVESSVMKLGDDTMSEYLNPHSPVFVAL